MEPPRGLSMSEIRKNAMDTAIGTIRNSADRSDVHRNLSTRSQMAMAAINTQAATGMRFHHAACV